MALFILYCQVSASTIRASVLDGHIVVLLDEIALEQTLTDAQVATYVNKDGSESHSVLRLAGWI